EPRARTPRGGVVGGISASEAPLDEEAGSVGGLLVEEEYFPVHVEAPARCGVDGDVREHAVLGQAVVVGRESLDVVVRELVPDEPGAGARRPAERRAAAERPAEAALRREAGELHPRTGEGELLEVQTELAVASCILLVDPGAARCEDAEVLREALLSRD